MRKVAFRDCHVALLVGARPRGPGMERKDLLLANAQIFSAQGKALNEAADRNVKVLVVGNPANTNALIARANAKDLDPRNFTAMMRLDHNRALSQLAEKTGAHVTDIRRMTIWGNHSATQYPDISHTVVQGQAGTLAGRRRLAGADLHSGRAAARRRHHQGARRLLGGLGRFRRDRPCAHLGPRHRGGRLGEHGVPSDGSYGIPEGVIYSYPVTCRQRRVPDRAGAGDRRVQPQAHGRHRGRAEGRARGGQGPARARSPSWGSP